MERKKLKKNNKIVSSDMKFYCKRNNIQNTENRKSYLKSNFGITLIALIITIIVMLILAGVVIMVLFGENGILNRAVNAADRTNNASVQSELELAVSAVVTEWNGKRSTEGLEENLISYMTKTRVESNMNTENYKLTAFVLNTENGVIVEYKGKTYLFTLSIAENGNGTKVTYGGISSTTDTGSVAQENEENATKELEKAVSDVVAEWNNLETKEGNLGTFMTKEKVESNMNKGEYSLTAFELNTKQGVTVEYKETSYLFTVSITESEDNAEVTYEGILIEMVEGGEAVTDEFGVITNDWKIDIKG